jgi:hypothetical protein
VQHPRGLQTLYLSRIVARSKVPQFNAVTIKDISIPPITEQPVEYFGACVCKGNLTDLRRELHLSLAKGNPK